MPFNLTLVRYFYRPIALFSLAISLTDIYLLSQLSFDFLAFSIFFKLFTYQATVFFQYNGSGQYKYFYYRNAGHSIRRMYLMVFSFDMVIYILMVTAFYFYQHGHLKG